MKNCLKCNFDKIVPDVLVLDRGDANGEHFLQVAIDEEPDALIFKSRQRSGVNCFMCVNCGYLEFYAKNPELIYQAYQNMLNNR